MNFITLLLAIPFTLVLVGALASLAWVASGSSDCNGDPERDAGYTDEQIARMSQSWDHGSAASTTRPSLEYARRQNRNELARSVGR